MGKQSEEMRSLVNLLFRSSRGTTGEVAGKSARASRPAAALAPTPDGPAERCTAYERRLLPLCACYARLNASAAAAGRSASSPAAAAAAHCKELAFTSQPKQSSSSEHDCTPVLSEYISLASTAAPVQRSPQGQILDADEVASQPPRGCPLVQRRTGPTGARTVSGDWLGTLSVCSAAPRAGSLAYALVC